MYYIDMKLHEGVSSTSPPARQQYFSLRDSLLATESGSERSQSCLEDEIEVLKARHEEEILDSSSYG